MILSIIVAVGRNNVIGKDNIIPWDLPGDRKRFLELSSGHIVVMGRKTFESIGKPLKNRRNIVLSSNRNYEQSGVEVVCSVDDVLKLINESDEVEAFVIGGGEIYRLFLPYVNKVYLTKVEADFEGDRFFPDLGNGWVEAEREGYKKDDENKYDYCFIIYERQ